MKFNPMPIIYFLFILIMGAAGISPAEASALQAFVSIAPQKYFVQKIGGAQVAVSVLVPPGADPHTYEPKPAQMRALAKCDIYFAVGVDFEKAWLKKMVSFNSRMLIVHTEEGLPRIPVAGSHDHGQDSKHQAASPDPHIWLSPPLVKQQADHILSALVRVDPKNEKLHRANYAHFLREIESLDRELRDLFSKHPGEPFLVLHPSWGYFARAYGLQMISMEMEGKEPKPAQLQKLIQEARKKNIRVVFAQPQFSSKSAEIISREIGGGVVLVDPLAEDWAENLRRAARQFISAFGKK
ncbi:MAG: zinc ABC transporter substrate-binding protein [Thermodesulfobacteriota bacterium]